MLEYKEFTVESSKELFRIGKISPVDLLAITTQVNLNSFEQTKVIFTFALEHIEVKVVETWLPVKTKDRDIYQPKGIENKLVVLNDLVTYFLNEVIAKTFTQSSK